MATREINTEEIEKALRGVSLPPRPAISMEIREVYPNVEKVADIVSRDPGIASALLRTINSPFYGLRYEIKSIRQAAVYMGLESIVNIVNTVLVRSNVGDTLDEKFMSVFWDSTNDTAVAMMALCQFLGLPDMADEAYTVGLFHNCGIPLLMTKHPKYAAVLAKCYRQCEKDIMVIESEIFGSSHPAVGYYICKTWGLSEKICEAVLEHHNTTAIPDLMLELSDTHTLLGLLKMAEHITMEYDIMAGASENYEWDTIKMSVLDYFELTEEDFVDLQEQIVEQLDADEAERIKM